MLSDPELLFQQPLVQALASRVGFTSASELLLPATLTFAVAAVLAALIRLANLWVNGHLAAAVGSDLSCEAYRRTLYQPYALHVSRNSSALIASISTDVNRVIFGVINPLLLLLSSALIALSLVGTLLAIDWAIAVGAGLVISLVYCLAMVTGKRPLQQLGQQQVHKHRRPNHKRLHQQLCGFRSQDRPSPCRRDHVR